MLLHKAESDVVRSDGGRRTKFSIQLESQGLQTNQRSRYWLHLRYLSSVMQLWILNTLVREHDRADLISGYALSSKSLHSYFAVGVGGACHVAPDLCFRVFGSVQGCALGETDSICTAFGVRRWVRNQPCPKTEFSKALTGSLHNCQLSDRTASLRRYQNWRAALKRSDEAAPLMFGHRNSVSRSTIKEKGVHAGLFTLCQMRARESAAA